MKFTEMPKTPVLLRVLGTDYSRQASLSLVQRSHLLKAGIDGTENNQLTKWVFDSKVSHKVLRSFLRKNKDLLITAGEGFILTGPDPEKTAVVRELTSDSLRSRYVYGPKCGNPDLTTIVEGITILVLPDAEFCAYMTQYYGSVKDHSIVFKMADGSSIIREEVAKRITPGYPKPYKYGFVVRAMEECEKGPIRGSAFVHRDSKIFDDLKADWIISDTLAKGGFLKGLIGTPKTINMAISVMLKARKYDQKPSPLLFNSYGCYKEQEVRDMIEEIVTSLLEDKEETLKAILRDQDPENSSEIALTLPRLVKSNLPLGNVLITKALKSPIQHRLLDAIIRIGMKGTSWRAAFEVEIDGNPSLAMAPDEGEKVSYREPLKPQEAFIIELLRFPDDYPLNGVMLVPQLKDLFDGDCDGDAIQTIGCDTPIGKILKRKVQSVGGHGHSKRFTNVAKATKTYQPKSETDAAFRACLKAQVGAAALIAYVLQHGLTYMIYPGLYRLGVDNVEKRQLPTSAGLLQDTVDYQKKSTDRPIVKACLELEKEIASKFGVPITGRKNPLEIYQLVVKHLVPTKGTIFQDKAYKRPELMGKFLPDAMDTLSRLYAKVSTKFRDWLEAEENNTRIYIPSGLDVSETFTLHVEFNRIFDKYSDLIKEARLVVEANPLVTQDEYMRDKKLSIRGELLQTLTSTGRVMAMLNYCQSKGSSLLLTLFGRETFDVISSIVEIRNNAEIIATQLSFHDEYLKKDSPEFHKIKGNGKNIIGLLSNPSRNHSTAKEWFACISITAGSIPIKVLKHKTKFNIFGNEVIGHIKVPNGEYYLMIPSFKDLVPINGNMIFNVELIKKG